MRWLVRIAAFCTLTALAACSSNYGDPVAPYETPDDDPVLEGLRPASELSEDIAGWPGVPFSPENFVSTVPALEVGDIAIDFTLEDVDGNPHRLADYLSTKPVLLMIGSYTCPVYQSKLQLINALDEQSFDASSSYADKVHFIHVYVVEAHPQAPDPSPHYGVVYEDAYSTLRQPMKYVDRVANARVLMEQFDPQHLLLVDDLGSHGPNNPVWSSYGSGAASAWLIRPDGRIMAAHEWVDVRTLRKSINAMLLAG